MVSSRSTRLLPNLPPDLLQRALSPELHRESRAACCQIWPWWFVGFVLVVWVIAKQGTYADLGLIAGTNNGGGAFGGTEDTHAHALRQQSLLAAMVGRFTRTLRPARAPTPKELLPKGYYNLWRLGELAFQIKHASSTVTHLSAPSSLPGTASSEQQQKQHQHLRQLQQQAASLMSASLEHGADDVTPELLDKMQVALKVWEKSESLQARLRSLFSLGTFMYCLGIVGIIIVVLPLARWLGVKILQVAYTTIPKVIKWLRLGQVIQMIFRFPWVDLIQDIGSVLLFALVRIHNVLLMPIYPGVGLLISTILIAAAKHQRQSAGSLLALSGIALAVLNLTVVLKLWLKWSKWLSMWTLMQPLVPQLAPEDMHQLVKGHAEGAAGFATILALLIQREPRLADLLRELERRSSPNYKEGNLAPALHVPFVLVLSAPLARALSSQLLGFGAASSLFFTAMIGATAVENSLLGAEGRPPPGPLGNHKDGAWLIPGDGPEPTLAASLTMLLIQALAHGAGVGEQLAPFRIGFNVFGSMALLFMSFLYSYEPVCKRWAERRGLPVAETVPAVKLANVVLPVAAVLLGSIWEQALFNVGCTFVVLNIFSGGWNLTSDAPWNLKILLISLVLCTIGWVIHAHPEFLARTFGLA